MPHTLKPDALHTQTCCLQPPNLLPHTHLMRPRPLQVREVIAANAKKPARTGILATAEGTAGKKGSGPGRPKKKGKVAELAAAQPEVSQAPSTVEEDEEDDAVTVAGEA
jgi:hypothetical protein